MGLASIIISAATKEIAGFTVIGYLTEKAADIGTGKIWTELKKKIGDRPDSFECRLYGAIEKSVGEYLCKGTTEDVSAAICEYIFDAWCREGYLTPKRISNILHGYSSYAKQNDILAWYRTFQDQIIKDDILYPMFMMNNIQLSGELQREQDKKMTVIEALFLGLIQGVTEFLPISSSAHLIIFRHFMKIEDTQTVFFNVLLHFGSMIAILLTFSKEWKRLFLALCGIIIDLFHNLKEHFSSQHQERKQYRKVLGSNYRMLAFLLILTTIPTAVIGGMIQSLVTLTSSNLLAPGVGLYLTAILLVVADMLPEGEKTQKNLKPKDALIAGFFQGFSTIPGLSRLGSTISACVIGGMTRSYAVKYSLIVSVPAIIGATIVELATMGKNKIVFHPVYLVGVFMAALAGYFTIRILMRVVKKRKLKYFALYCLLVGTFSIAGYFLL